MKNEIFLPSKLVKWPRVCRYGRSFMSGALCLVLLLSLCGCGKSEEVIAAEELIDSIGEISLNSGAAIRDAKKAYEALERKEQEKVENSSLIEQAEAEYENLWLHSLIDYKWVNVNDGDIYSFEDGGKGTHDNMAISYKIDEQDIAITEGAGTLQHANFTLDLSGVFPMLVPEDQSEYYVHEEDFAEVGAQVREESVRILTSTEFWKAKSAVNYISFAEGGYGWFLVTGTTLGLSWEMEDNNTVQISVDYNGGYSIQLDVVNDNGNYKLVKSDGEIAYVPKS